MLGPNGVSNHTPRKLEAFDPGQIFNVQHDRELPRRCGVNNLTNPVPAVSKRSKKVDELRKPVPLEKVSTCSLLRCKRNLIDKVRL